MASRRAISSPGIDAGEQRGRRSPGAPPGTEADVDVVLRCELARAQSLLASATPRRRDRTAHDRGGARASPDAHPATRNVSPRGRKARSPYITAIISLHEAGAPAGAELVTIADLERRASKPGRRVRRRPHRARLASHLAAEGYTDAPEGKSRKESLCCLVPPPEAARSGAPTDTHSPRGGCARRPIPVKLGRGSKSDPIRPRLRPNRGGKLSNRFASI
jgi:hypothetical protein